MQDYEKKYTAKDLKGPDKATAQTEIIEEVVKDIGSWYTAFRDNIDTYSEDFRFMFKDQWDDALRAVRNSKKKQILTVNYLYPMAQKLIGEEIANEPDVIIRPDPEDVDSNDDAAEIREGLLRKIFNETKFNMVKTNVFKSCVFGGWGVFKISYDYEDASSFHKKITIEAAENATSCFFDPNSNQNSKEDSEFCGYYTMVEKDLFHELYPEATSDLSFKIIGGSETNKMEWSTKKAVRVVDIWRKEYFTLNLALLSTGETMSIKEAERMMEHQNYFIDILKQREAEGMPSDPKLMQPISIVKRRKTRDYVITHYKMVRDEIIEVAKWPSKLMPLVFVDFDSIFLDGRQTTKSFHRDAKDMQKYLNYVASQSADALMNLHHGNWIATPEMLDGNLMDLWLRPQNDKGILLANRDAQGELPHYIPPPQISPAFDTQYARTVRDIQNILGMSDSARGLEDNATSGRAINQRATLNNISQTAPLHHLRFAVEQVSRVCLSLIPALYDYMRPAAIIPKKGASKTVMLNEKTPYGIKNDMSKGKFKVMIESGVSFAAQRTAAIQQISMIIQGDPTLKPLLIEFIAENADLPNSPAIVSRIRKFLMGMPIPQIIAEETGEKLPPPKPNPQEMMMKQEMEIKERHQKVEEERVSNDQIKTQIETQKLLTGAVTDHEKHNLKVAEMRNKKDIDVLKSRTELLNAALSRNKG